MPAKHKIWDQQLVDQIVSYIEVGNYIVTACAAAGLGEATFHKWMRDAAAIEERVTSEEMREAILDGEVVEGFTEQECLLLIFRHRVIQASARSEAYAVAMVRKHMPDQWTAAMTYLERRFPGRWKRREQIEHSETDNTGIDETLLLSDPTAVKLVHDALDRVAQGQLAPPRSEIVSDAVVIDDDKAPDD